jgi:hypothetical protein
VGHKRGHGPPKAPQPKKKHLRERESFSIFPQSWGMRCNRAVGPVTSEYVMDVGVCIMEGMLLLHFSHMQVEGYDVMVMRKE